ncbi:hypothetical protein ACDQ55_21195 [Chitinophaga sp. 30R24]|uniref:hypothetical protein n=1 Tax=Chitinophaga sp. 30R24 TaxID=3248838 RepID=UPI003B904486
MMPKKIYISLLLFFTSIQFLQAQNTTSIKANYDTAFMMIKMLVYSDIPKAFKKAVFITEYTYQGNQLDYQEFDNYIEHLTFLCQKWVLANPIQGYHYSDSINLQSNYAIYNVMKDTVRMIVSGSTDIANLPYTYNFEDFFGHRDWSNMFVSKLLITHKGNCHSLPYLYKILADELNSSCWLTLAPNHIYIKNRCKKSGWYNTELTSGNFPIDAWITASGYISLEAIRSGIYMDTLSNKQAIAMCLLDLAKGYERQVNNYEDGYILRCCDFVLQQHSQNVQALLLKAEVLKRIYAKQSKDTIKQIQTTETYAKMTSIYGKLIDLGYREMPEQMYINWLQSVIRESEKFSNKKIWEGLSTN